MAREPRKVGTGEVGGDKGRLIFIFPIPIPGAQSSAQITVQVRKMKLTHRAMGSCQEAWERTGLSAGNPEWPGAPRSSVIWGEALLEGQVLSKLEVKDK